VGVVVEVEPHVLPSHRGIEGDGNVDQPEADAAFPVGTRHGRSRLLLLHLGRKRAPFPAFATHRRLHRRRSVANVLLHGGIPCSVVTWRPPARGWPLPSCSAPASTPPRAWPRPWSRTSRRSSWETRSRRSWTSRAPSTSRTRRW